MIDLDDELRHTLQDLAGRGEPPTLGYKAIEAVRKRRQRSRIAVIAAAVAIVVALIPMLLTRLAPQEHMEPSAPSPQTTVEGSNVVAAYADQSNRWHLLDKATGAYVALPARQRVVAVSPTLDWVATADKDGLSVSATAKGSVPRKLIPPTGFVYDFPVFAPDGRHVVLPMVELHHDSFGRVMVMELASQSFTVMELPLAANRVATTTSWWRGNLLFGTRDITDGSSLTNVTYLAVSLAGAAVLDRQVPAGLTEPGNIMWTDTGQVRDDSVVVIQRLPRGQVSLAVHDLGPRMRQLTHPVLLSPLSPTDDQATTEKVLAWRSPSQVVVAQWVTREAQLLVVDLYAGTITPAPFPVPAGAKEVIVT